MQTENTQTGKKTDAELLQGGPAGNHNEPMPGHGAVHPELQNAPANNAAPKAPETKHIYELNGKTFQSAQELSLYVANLEKKVVQQTMEPVKPVVPPQVPTSKKLIDGRPIEDVMFEDPAKVYNHMKAEVKAESELAAQQEKNRIVFWTDFYNANPDLKGKEEIIDGLCAKNGGKWQALSVADFGREVASTARTVLRKAGLANAEEIPNNGVAALSSSATTPNNNNSAPAKPTNFYQEMRAYRGKDHKVK